MSEELKPCPFCGGEADPEGWMNGDGECGPECESCGATASSVIVWNRRAELTAIKAGQGEAVAWECTAVRGGVSMQRSTWKSEEDADGWIEHYKARDCQTTKTPLYTAQPASANARVVPVELLAEAAYWLGVHSSPCSIEQQLADELRALLAQSESVGVKP